MSDSKFNPPYRFEYSEHGPVTIYDAIDVGWIARVKESLPHKREIAEAIVDGLNAAAARERAEEEGHDRAIERAWRVCVYCGGTEDEMMVSQDPCDRARGVGPCANLEVYGCLWTQLLEERILAGLDEQDEGK